MNQIHFLQRRYKQFGTTYFVEFGVDILNQLIWLNESSFSEVLGQIPTYRKATDKITPVLGDRQGSWFPISQVPIEGLEHLKPRWVSNWLKESLELLHRFHLAEPEDYGEPAYQELFDLVKLWE